MRLDPWKISADLRLRFLEPLYQNTLLSTLQKQPGIDFYLWYLQTQVEAFQSNFNHMISPKHTTTTKSLDPFFEVLLVLWEHARDEQGFSLDTATQALQSSQVVISNDDSGWQPNMDQQLAFFMLGPLSMLYKPGGDKFSADVFQIENKNPITRYHHEVFRSRSIEGQHIRTCTPFGKFLRRFGGVLLHTAGGYDHESIKDTICPTFGADRCNAYILQLNCNVKFAWTDLLDTHLDFDKTNRTLYIFRFPSFCMLNIPAIEGNGMENVLHRLVIPSSFTAYFQLFNKSTS